MSYPEHDNAEDAFYNPHGARPHRWTHEEEVEQLHESKWFNKLSKEDQEYYETWAGYGNGH